MMTSQYRQAGETDPLGLGNLPMMTPGEDGWPAIEAALMADRQSRQRRHRAAGWLAAAASLVLVIGIAMRLPGPPQSGPLPVTEHDSATQVAAATSTPDEDPVAELIVMSQTLEKQLRSLRDGTGSVPAESAVYVAELEDLVAQVDTELSFSPRSVNLWGQRVNLLLDLAQIYQHQWERDYGRVAAL
jgi:hypothetical protein